MEIRLTRHGRHVAVVTIDNQPRRNAMTRGMLGYKVPARLAFRAADELPRTPTGKIHKPGLRAELARDE